MFDTFVLETAFHLTYELGDEWAMWREFYHLIISNHLNECVASNRRAVLAQKNSEIVWGGGGGADIASRWDEMHSGKLFRDTENGFGE